MRVGVATAAGSRIDGDDLIRRPLADLAQVEADLEWAEVHVIEHDRECVDADPSLPQLDLHLLELKSE